MGRIQWDFMPISQVASLFQIQFTKMSSWNFSQVVTNVSACILLHHVIVCLVWICSTIVFLCKTYINHCPEYVKRDIHIRRDSCYLPCIHKNQSKSLKHWGRDKMDAISQTTFSSAFSWMKMFEFWLKFHWNLFIRVKLTIFHYWFRLWLGADQATSHYLNQWWLV